jgi:aconitate hydratase 2/2-methylisocitrate dehydratase
VDINTQHTLPDFIQNWCGISLRQGNGIIHSWLDRMLLPDQVGTGGDSHTRFPLGNFFPAVSSLVAFGTALGVVPLDMQGSVLVKFTGKIQPGISLRDLVNVIPYAVIQWGLLTAEQAFELSDASAERSAGGCIIELSEKPVSEYLRSNIFMLLLVDRQRLPGYPHLGAPYTCHGGVAEDQSLMYADADAE